MRRLLMGGVAVLALVVANMAIAARGYSDVAGDSNSAPDITSVEVSEATPGVLAIRLSISNYASLPARSWVNLWFDLDSDEETGAAGDEALVRYSADGGVELFAWDGSQLVAGSTDSVTASFAAGLLTVSMPRASIAAEASFGMLVVSSRAQSLGEDELIASDFAPDAGRSAYAGPATTAFPDPTGDHDAAPDLTSVRVSDAKSGWITFAITTANYASLPSASAIVLSIDADSNPETGEGGAELTVTMVGGEVVLDRWNGRRWARDTPPMQVRVRTSRNVVAIDLHVRELDNARRFGFSLLSADLNTVAEGVVAVDFAPSDLSYWGYALANRPALILVATEPVATPLRPRAGRSFTVSLPVRRSDTGRSISSGNVDCRVRAAGAAVPATGRVARGSATCAFVVPRAAKGKVVRGTITVRVDGKVVARDFAFVVL
ncbi:MAG: hypothetical protein ABW012_01315 [Gaiellaceae bacterium]